MAEPAQATGTPEGPRLYTAAQVADLLQVKQSWIEEQARRRRIPFTMPANSYRFSSSHIEEIIALFEKLPCENVSTRPASARRSPSKPGGGTVTTLKARPPKARRAAGA